MGDANTESQFASKKAAAKISEPIELLIEFARECT
jgi:hypothetical protein